jgi:phospholipid-binding lipoprotein MlaA
VRLARSVTLAGLLAATLLAAGCASSDFSVRNDPSQTPAADNAAAIKRMEQLRAVHEAPPETAPAPAAQASDAAGELPAVPAAPGGPAAPGDQSRLGPPLTAADVPSMLTYDPWERMNRFTYRFNARFDEAVFLPVANGYRKLPAPVRSGVHNFLSNLTEVISTANYVVQLRLPQAVRSLGRFVINSTIGIGGIFDVATRMHIPAARTGFGATLARWGVHPGPYLVIPLLGPYTLRDGFGFAADFGTAYGVNFPPVYRNWAGWVITPVGMVDARANADFRYYGTGSVFEYDDVRFLYVRKTLIEDDAIRLWHRKAATNPKAEAGR